MLYDTPVCGAVIEVGPLIEPAAPGNGFTVRVQRVEYMVPWQPVTCAR